MLTTAERSVPKSRRGKSRPSDDVWAWVILAGRWIVTISLAKTKFRANRSEKQCYSFIRFAHAKMPSKVANTHATLAEQMKGS